MIRATDRQLQAVLSAENVLPALEQVVCLFDPGHVKSSRKLWSWESVLDLGSQHLSRHQAEQTRRLAASDPRLSAAWSILRELAIRN